MITWEFSDEFNICLYNNSLIYDSDTYCKSFVCYVHIAFVYVLTVYGCTVAEDDSTRSRIFERGKLHGVFRPRHPSFDI